MQVSNEMVKEITREIDSEKSGLNEINYKTLTQRAQTSARPAPPGGKFIVMCCKPTQQISA